MDFELTEEQKMLKKNAHDFWEKEIDPIVDEREARASIGEVFSKEELINYQKTFMPFGYVTGPVPVEYGGEGLNQVTRGVLLEEGAYWWVSLTSSFTIAYKWTTVRGMSDKLKEKYAKRIHGPDMDLIIAGGISEPNASSSAPRGIEFMARLEGNPQSLRLVGVIEQDIHTFGAGQALHASVYFLDL